MSASILLRVLLLTGLAGCHTPSVPAGDPGVPDIVLVSIDTLRADHLGCYGHSRDTSPFLDSLAAQGRRYAHARAPSPWTLPSHVTMLSGWMPARHLAVEDDIGIAPEIPLISETLAAHGFATGGFTSTLFVSRKFGFERGFQTFDDGDIRTSKQNLAGEVTATHVVDRALKWLRGIDPGEPAFLFVHFYDAHYAYDPPAPWDTHFDRAPTDDDARYRKYHWYQDHPLDHAQLTHQRAQYDEAIRYVDAELQRLHSAMQAAGRRASWLITADHGEEFGERGSWGHAHTLYPEQLQVPLILSGARVQGPPSVVQAVAGLQDIPPTLAAWAGAEHPAGDGVDLGALSSSAAPRAFVADTSRFSTNRMGIWLDGWRLDLDLTKGGRELYRTSVDPLEEQDLAAQDPDQVRALETRLFSELGAPWSCSQDVQLRSRRGRILSASQLQGRKASLQAGTRFQLLPVDAEIQLAGGDDWLRAPSSPPTQGAPVSWQGPQARAVSLTPEERAQLEALGYIQGEN